MLFYKQSLAASNAQRGRCRLGRWGLLEVARRGPGKVKRALRKYSPFRSASSEQEFKALSEATNKI